MIIDIDLIAYDFMTDFNGPERHYPNPFYPAGVYEEDNPKYKYGPETTEYPNLTLPCKLYDEWGNAIDDGYYMVALSRDMKYLELYQSNRLKARVKVIKLVEKMYTDEELSEESAIIARMQEAKTKKKLKKYREAEEDLIAFKERSAANTYADIEDSGRGYYILKYNCNGKKATGVIMK